MKTKLSNVLLLTFFALLSLTSCQNEITEITQPDSEQVLAPNSPLASLMVATSANEGFVDNIMDNSDCMSINLPVTIIVNSITITINTLEDLEIIEAIFDEFNDDVDELEFLFPITIILNDYTEIVINDKIELDDFIERCSNVDEPVKCVDFEYPISFSIFNSEFQIIDTVVIENDEELFHFLERLDDADGGAIIASLNFPVTMVFANGEAIEVHNNQELERVINEAEGLCDDPANNCDIEVVDAQLLECHWKIHYYNEDDNYRPYDVFFLENGEVKIVGQLTTVAITGNWNTSVTDAGVVLTISELTEFSDALEGDWLIVECHNDRFNLVREATGANNTRIVLKRHCADQPNCSAQEVRLFLNECQWFTGSIVFADVPSGAFHFLDDNVLVVVNSATNEEIVGNWFVELTDEGIILSIDLPEPYNLISKRWLISECGELRVKMINGDHYLVFERECQNNPFECFENRAVAICDDGDVFDGLATFNLNEVYANCPQDNVEISFYFNEADAHANIEALPLEYTNIENEQQIIAKVTLAGTDNYRLFLIVLIVEDCNPSCTETQVDTYLIGGNCHWVPVVINASNEFNTYDIYFGENQNIVLVINGTETFGTWSTFQGADGVIVSISQINEPLLQQFNGEWLVVECGPQLMVLTNNNIELVLELECQ